MPNRQTETKVPVSEANAKQLKALAALNGTTLRDYLDKIITDHIAENHIEAAELLKPTVLHAQ